MYPLPPHLHFPAQQQLIVVLHFVAATPHHHQATKYNPTESHNMLMPFVRPFPSSPTHILHYLFGLRDVDNLQQYKSQPYPAELFDYIWISVLGQACRQMFPMSLLPQNIPLSICF